MFPLELRTARVSLRGWTDDDLEPLAAIYSQPEYLAFMPAMGLEKTRAQIQKFRTRWKEDGFAHWAMADLATGTLIGRLGLMRLRTWPLREGAVEVGWALHRDWYGQGLATEGGRAALECWREHLVDDAQLISVTESRNLRSRAVMERLGMSLRGTVQWSGMNVIWYGIDR